MQRIGILLTLMCLLTAAGCRSNGDSRRPDSRDAWLDATGGRFDGSLPD